MNGLDHYHNDFPSLAHKIHGICLEKMPHLEFYSAFECATGLINADFLFWLVNILEISLQHVHEFSQFEQRIMAMMTTRMTLGIVRQMKSPQQLLKSIP